MTANRVPHRAASISTTGAVKRSAFWKRTLLALSLGIVAAPGLADDDCDVPVQHWQSRDAVRRMAAAQGWQVHRLKIDDGCYEIRGIDAEGRAFKARIDPQTLDIIKLKHKKHDGGQAHRHAPGSNHHTPSRDPIVQ